ncbi:hypothetical protein V2J09_011252 [Rumex salicifolius]
MENCETEPSSPETTVSSEVSLVPDGQPLSAPTPGEGNADQPPGEPPDKTPSWDGLLRKLEWQHASAVSANLITSGKVQVTFPHAEDGSPWIQVADEVMDALTTPWKCSIIIKLPGRMISFPVFKHPSGGIVISNLPNNFFLVHFMLDADLVGALTGDPWTIFGHYMMVRISGLPMMMYDKNLLFAISSTIENPLRIENNTLNATRWRFARVCVEVELTKLLKGEMFVNGERLQIEYESLHLICDACRRYGHDCDHCLFNAKQESVEETNLENQQGKQTLEEKAAAYVVGVRPWGSWMNVNSRVASRVPRQPNFK